MSSDLLIRLGTYLLSFIVIWFGSGLIVRTVTKFSYRLHMSSFTVSFVLLGLLTSIPEFAVGINALSTNEPEIFIGNLLGSIMVLFALVIPMLAVAGDGIKINSGLTKRNLLLIIFVIATPAFLIIDRRVGNFEAMFMIFFYLVVMYIVQRRPNIKETVEKQLFKPKISYVKDIGAATLGVILVIAASNAIVTQTQFFSDALGIAPFYISLILLSLGTNLPELSLGIRSVLLGKKDVAFGNYLGSAATNTLLFGIFSFMTPGVVFSSRSYVETSLFIFATLGVFYFFSLSQSYISRREGLLLLCLYVVFLFVELT